MKRATDLRAKAESLAAQEAAFISGGAATQADRVERTERTQRRLTGAGKMPAEGYRRTSIDLPLELYRTLKITAAEEDRTLQSIAEEAFRAWLEKRKP